MHTELVSPSKPPTIAELASRVSELESECDTILNACDMPLLIVSNDPERVLQANTAAAKLFRRPVGALVGTLVKSCICKLPGEPFYHGDGAAELVLIVDNSAAAPQRACMVRRVLPGGDPPKRELISLARANSGGPTAAASGQRGTSLGMKSCTGSASFIGSSDASRRVCRLIGKVARTDSTVLIQGESGTGKEVCAKAIHLASSRADQSFVGVNCAALSESLLESELFGHVKGAFTGAVGDRHGRFWQAHRGTLLLDEIGSMAMSSQSRLLRVLQERCFEPVGSSKSTNVEARIIATTNVDLARAVNQGSFREDLFYRLNVITIEMPPLRERPEDIPLLVFEFIGRHNKKLGKHLQGISPEAMERLLNQSWPGNVRQLENTLERAAVLEESEVIQSESLGFDDLPATGRDATAYGLALKRQLEIIERHIVLDTLRRSNWVCKCAAERLGIDPKNFNYFLRKHKISVEARHDASLSNT